MKPLTVLNNNEKARLLHSLFPEDIPPFLQFVKGMSQTIREEQEVQRDSWPEGHLLTFDFWLSLASQAEKTIEKYNSKLKASSSLFADQLFDGYNALFTTHCLVSFVTIRRHTNPKFTIAVDLLFNP